MKTIRLHLCNKFLAEYEHVLNQSKSDGLELVPFACADRQDMGEEVLHKDSRHVDYIITFEDCLYYEKHEAFFGHHVMKMDSCFNHILDQSLLDHLKKGHVFVTNEKWLENWKSRLEELGVGPANDINKVLLISDIESESVTEFADYLGCELDRVPPSHELIRMRLDLIKERVVNMKISQSVEHFVDESGELQRRLAESLMVNQLVRELFVLSDTKEIIKKTKNILMMLLGAKYCEFIEDRELKQAFYSEYQHKEISFFDPLRQRIYIKSEYNHGFFGYWQVEDFNMPENTLKYINVSKMIGTLFSLALSRQDMVERLKVSQANLLHQEKMASIGQMAGGLAHEINNPLGYISCNIDTFEKYFDDLAANYKTLYDRLGERFSDEHLSSFTEDYNDIQYIFEDKPELLEEIVEGISRIESIVKRFRSFTNVDGPTELAVFDMNDLLRDTAYIFENNFSQTADIELNLNEIPMIFGNKSEISLTVYDIINNAIEAIERTNKQSKGLVLIETEKKGDDVIIRITDNGEGITDDLKHKLFDPFFSTKPIGSGVGLGLTFAYDVITQRHKGDIDIRNVESGLTECVIRLPGAEKEMGH